jgi:hypothetical protein
MPAPMSASGLSSSSIKTIRLSTEGLERAGWISEKDFVFFVGASEFWCSKFQSVFVSPLISAALHEDCTFASYALDCPGVIEDELLKFLENLLRGCPICLSSRDFNPFRRLCQ